MARWTPAILAVLSAGLGVALAVERASLAGTREELSQVRTRLDRLETRMKESVAREKIEGLEEQMDRVEKKAVAASAAALAAAGAAKSAASPREERPPAFTEEDLQKIVDARIEEKLQARGDAKKESGDRKIPLFDLAKELALGPEAQARVTSIANSAKKDIFDLLRTPRPDGTNFADEILTAFTSGDPQAAQKVAARLFTDKIPGTDVIYASAVQRVQERANQGLAQAMGPDSFTRFQGMNVHPENIETGFDPWVDHLQQRGK